MPKSGFHDLQKTNLIGPDGLSVTLKVGDKFCWINPELESGTAAAAAKRMIKDYGAGPFVCNKITRVPAGHTILTFVDKNGKEEREITKVYFTTYE